MIKAKKPLEATIQKDYGHKVESGWLKNATHKAPDFKRFKTLLGGRTVATSPKRPSTLFQVIKWLHLGKRPVFTRPAKTTKATNFQKTVSEMGKGEIAKRKSKIIDFAKAIFRVPMLKGLYKKEGRTYLKRKTFSRPTILTGQTLKSIDGRVQKQDLKLKVKGVIK